MMKWLRRISPLLALAAVFGNSANARSDDEGVQTEQVIVVSAAEATAEATAEAGGDEQSVHITATIVGDPMKDVDKALQEAGLEGETLQKVREAVRKALKGAKIETRVVEPGSFRILKAIPEGTVIGPDQKEHRVELKMLREGLLHGPVTLKLEGILDKIAELKGVDEEQVKQVQVQIDQAVKGMAGSGPLMLQFDPNRYFIGVECAVLEDEQREKLQLAENVGLLVNAVFDGSPAEKAGIKQNDVIVEVGTQAMTSHEGLIEAVQIAGKNEKAVTLTLLRENEKLQVEVQPEQHKTPRIPMPAIPKLQWQGGEGKGQITVVLKTGEDGKTQAQTFSIGPAVITATPADPDVKALMQQVEMLTKKVTQLEEALKKSQSEEKSEEQ
jgi:hypothetical protein